MLVLRPAVALVVVALALGACAPTAARSAAADGRLSVVASFYPLQYLTERLGGDRVRVANLTKPGAEPHDLELSPQDVAALVDADLVVVLRGFQPAVDDAVASEAAERTFDAAPAADLDLAGPAPEDTHEVGGPAVSGASDPHFWLDPVRLAAVATALAQRLRQADPAGAAVYTANLGGLTRDLTALDTAFRAGLADCASTDLVTSHEAFGYLARRYGLRQVGITGLSPETEPDAGRLAEVARFVRANDVRTVYYETLVSPAVADTLANETGVRTAVLDPLEGLDDRSPGADYLAVMRADLASLVTGQGCR